MAKTLKAEQRGQVRLDNFGQYQQEKPSDFNVEWGFSPGEEIITNLLGVDKDTIEVALAQISRASENLSTVISILESVVDVISIILDTTSDIFSGLVVIIREVVESIINLFTSVSFNHLFHFPTTYKDRRRPNEILYDIGMAYVDKNDPNRPITVQETTFGYAILAMFSLPNIQLLQERLGSFKKLFKGYDSLFDFEEELNNVENRYTLKDEVFGKKEEFYVLITDISDGEVERLVRDLFLPFKFYKQSSTDYIICGPFNKSEAEKNKTKLEANVIARDIFPLFFITSTEDLLSSGTILRRDLEPEERILGQEPNFEKAIALTDWTPIRTLVDTLAEMALNIEKGNTALQRIKEIIRITKAKIDRILLLSDRTLKAFSSMISLLAFGEGQNMFACYGNGRASDFSRAFINAPLHPNYPRSDFLEPNFNNDGQIDTELVQSMMFSGALLLHISVPDPIADYEKINHLFNLFFKGATVTNLKEDIDIAVQQNFEN